MNKRPLIVFVILVIVTITIWLIHKQLVEYHVQDNPKLNELKEKFATFFNSKTDWKPPLQMLNTRNIMSDVKFFRGYKSYNINKKKVYMCLKDENYEYYDDNNLIYVLAHEISHSLCDEIGHTEKFHEIFQALLYELEKAGMYDSKIPIAPDYCKNGDPEM